MCSKETLSKFVLFSCQNRDPKLKIDFCAIVWKFSEVGKICVKFTFVTNNDL